MGAAMLLRALFVGFDKGMGLSVSYLPAFLLVTLYAGPRWGLAALASALGLNYLIPSSIIPISSSSYLSLMFTTSAAITIGAAAWLREALIRMDEARRRQEAMQAALDSTEARLRLAQEAGGVGLWDVDVTTGEGHWSPVLYRNLGLDPAVPANLSSLLTAVHPDDRDGVRQANIRALRERRMDSVEYRVVWSDGQVRWLLSRGELMCGPDGRVVRAAGVNIDVTERRLADQQLRESEARFRTLANRVPVLMWVSRNDNRREFVNQAYVDFLGVPYEAALDFDWRQRLHPEDCGRVLKDEAAGQASREPFVLEARYKRADGEDRWVRSLSQPRFGPGGEVAGYIGVGVDVTDAKRAEGDLKHINELLAERVQAALAERDQAEAALQRAQRLEAVGQLTGGVAHDFNNLLTVIIGALDLVRRHPNDEPRRERMLDAAWSAARRGERLTQQLLAFSRRQALKPAVLRVDDLLREIEPLLRQAVGDTARLTVSLGSDDVLSRIDPAQFEAAVMNLVVNARDAVTQGGVIRLESARCAVEAGEVEEAPAGGYVCVAVHDTGVGMEPEVAGRAFEPFFTTKPVGKGTGLGLSQVYGFARQSGGGVTIDSAPGKGATVRIYLPLVAEPAVAPEVERAPTIPRRTARLRILVVEDDAEVGDMVAAMLQELGHEALRADGAAAALDVIAKDARIDLMLTDLVMPGSKTGLDLAREASKQRPGLAVILSTGYAGDAVAETGEAPWPLLRKPYSADALARMIGEVVLARETA